MLFCCTCTFSARFRLCCGQWLGCKGETGKTSGDQERLPGRGDSWKIPRLRRVSCEQGLLPPCLDLFPTCGCPSSLHVHLTGGTNEPLREEGDLVRHSSRAQGRYCSPWRVCPLGFSPFPAKACSPPSGALGSSWLWCSSHPLSWRRPGTSRVGLAWAGQLGWDACREVPRALFSGRALLGCRRRWLRVCCMTRVWEAWGPPRCVTWELER